jgi:hypothetical protein
MARRPKNPFAPARRAASPFAPKPYKAPKEIRPRSRANEATLCQAIREKRLVSFRYKPTDLTARIIAPHVVWLTEAESACLFGLQLQSETGAAESSPQNFDPYKMVGLTVLAETFEPDLTFKRDAYENVICIVPR